MEVSEWSYNQREDFPGFTGKGQNQDGDASVNIAYNLLPHRTLPLRTYFLCIEFLNTEMFYSNSLRISFVTRKTHIVLLSWWFN